MPIITDRQIVPTLVVEDNAADVFLVREALKSRSIDFELFVLDDGEKAINFLARADADENAPCPQLLLLDLNLPRRSGLEILSFLRSTKRCARATVVVMTSSDSPQDRARVAELGVRSYFRKPSDLAEFMQLGDVITNLMTQH